MSHIQTYLYLSLLAFLAGNSAFAFQVPDTSPEKEKENLAILRSESPAAEKAIACKNLAIYGSTAAVPDLAKLLPNPQLSSWARIALEAIPGEESNEVLRDAAESLDGRLLVGVINSISFRRDTGAVNLLIKKLNDADPEVASAAAVALGHIGNADATKSLRAALKDSPAKVRSAVAEGCVLAAEQLHNAGDSVAAAEIYDEVRTTDVPMQRIVEATRGAILARKEEGISLLLEAFRSKEKKLFQLALGTTREFPGSKIDKVLAGELASIEPDRASLLIQALADRPETADVSAILSAVEQGDKSVRLSAISALQRIGDDSCLDALLRFATDGDKDISSAAQQTLAVLPGNSVNEKIAGLLPSAKGDQYRVVLDLVGQRRINAIENVQKALDSSDKAIRSSALLALGETVSLDQLPVLVSQVVRPKHAADLPVAQKALRAASVRMPDREACATKLAMALKTAPARSKSTLLEIIADVGGANALKTLAIAAKSNDPQLQDTGSRLLGTWNSVAAAPVLLDLAKTGPAEKYRVRALRGYLGLARKFSMPDSQRAAMCQNAFDSTQRVSEHKLALEVLKIHPSAPGLKLALNAIKDPALKDDATAAAMVIAQKVGGNGGDVRKLLSGAGLEKVKLEIVKAQYGAGNNQKDVTNLLSKQAGGLPLITLASNYNASFGGDPAPGVVKKLKVEYRINGKPGSASFDENALILLPMPK